MGKTLTGYRSNMRSRWGYALAVLLVVSGSSLALALVASKAGSLAEPTKGFQAVAASGSTLMLTEGRYDIVYEPSSSTGPSTPLDIDRLSLAVTSESDVRRPEWATGPGDLVFDLDDDASTRLGFVRVFEAGAYELTVRGQPGGGALKAGQLPSLHWIHSAVVLLAVGAASGALVALVTFVRRHPLRRLTTRPAVQVA